MYGSSNTTPGWLLMFQGMALQSGTVDLSGLNKRSYEDEKKNERGLGNLKGEDLRVDLTKTCCIYV